MNCIRYLNTFEEVEELVSNVQKRRIFYSNFMEHYRGQGRPDYQLIPNISRKLTTAKEAKDKELDLIIALKTALKKESIESLLRFDINLSSEQNLWNVLIQAQHLGVSTRFLDWTLKWEVGLWFAVENPDNDSVDGQFWVFSVPDDIHLTVTRNNFYSKDLSNLDKTYLINPPIYWSGELSEQIGEIKRLRQFGKFTISPYDKSIIPLENQPEINTYLEKYCIPAKSKMEIRLKLASLGLHKEWLYYQDAKAEILEKIDKIT